MAFYCNGKMGVCEKNKTGCSTCDYLDGSGGKEIPDAPLTNADRIRAMSDEELAEFLGNWAQRHLVWMCDSQGECLAWLQEPAKEGEAE